MKYGYVRVSCAEKQEFDRQELILKDYNLDSLFEEKISGMKTASKREQFEKMLSVLQEGDEIYFESMSRMARSMQDLIATTNLLVKKYKVTVVFLKENIRVGDSGMNAMTALVFNIMGAFAQFERDLISDRTKEGLRAKKENGVKLGKPRTISEETETKVIRAYNSGLAMQEVADLFGIAKSTVHTIIKRGAL